ncbi:MAG: hypothetical protein WBA82_11430 [Castellaniella sp.]|uniref:hypothetical protein n=1 Tax=Castellaniella sp. TaxID=1955812 RepID=UPI003C7584EC
MNTVSTQSHTAPHGSTQAEACTQTSSSQTILNQQPDPDLDDFVDLYAPAPRDMPPSSEITLDEFDLIESEHSFESLISQNTAADIPAGLKTAFLPDDAPLNHELNLRAEQDLNAQPQDFLKFVSKNTNPQRTWFSFKNLLHIIADLVSLKKPTMVLNQNCVHCAAAVDRTLAQFTPEGRGSNAPKLYQVAEGRRGSFEALMNQHPGQALEDQSQFVQDLTEVIGKGSRGCISIPVKNYPFSHAMNVVHMADGGGPYIVCGQQNRVYNLSEPTDLQHFWDRYEIQQGRMAIITKTGQAPEATATVSGANMQAMDRA